MLKSLLKKNMQEIFRGWFRKSKTGEKRSLGMVIFRISIFVALLAFIGTVSGFANYKLCGFLYDIGLCDLYFNIVCIAALTLGVFGSVYNTYSVLYCSKDNDALMCLPIKSVDIVLSRIISVYIMGFMYSGIVMIPSIIVYYINVACSFSMVMMPILLFIDITIIVFVLSCLLGFIVSLATAKLKNKSIVIVLISLAVLFVYYILCFKSGEILSSIITKGEEINIKMHMYAYPLYAMGKMGAGGGWYAFGVTATTIVLCAITIFTLIASFNKLVIAKAGDDKYSTTLKAKQSGIQLTLLQKEFKRLFSSAMYMLNSVLGCAFLVVVGVMLLIKQKDIANVIPYMEMLESRGNVLILVAMFVILLFGSLNAMTAPLVSLEGKNIWLLHSLPIKSKDILMSKLVMSIIFNLPFMLFADIALCIVFKLKAWAVILLLLTSIIYVIFAGALGLYLDLRHPKMNWINEVSVIKTSIPALLFMLICVGLTMGLVVVYYLLRKVVFVALFGWLSCVLYAVLTALLLWYIFTKGVKTFDNL